MPIKDATFHYWEGSTASASETKLPKNRSIWEGKYQVLNFADVASGGATQSEEKIVGCELLETHTKIANARITKVHGSYQSGHVLNAGTATTFAIPKSAGTPSTVATSAIPATFLPTTPLTMDFDTTLNEYQYLFLQSDISAATTTYTASKQQGQAGYPWIQVKFAIEEYDSDSTRQDYPGAIDPKNAYTKTGTWLFFIDDNDELQTLGCFNNEMAYNGSLEWTELLKGAMNTPQSLAFNKRNSMITGNIYTLDGAVWKQLYHSTNLGSDGWYTEYNMNSDWKNVKKHEVFFLTYSDEGRELLIRFPNAAIRATGDIPFGSDGTSVPFECYGLGDHQVYISDNLVDVHYFAVNQSLT